MPPVAIDKLVVDKSIHGAVTPLELLGHTALCLATANRHSCGFRLGCWGLKLRERPLITWKAVRHARRSPFGTGRFFMRIGMCLFVFFAATAAVAVEPP